MSDRAEPRVRAALRVGWLAKGALFAIVGLLAIGLARRQYGQDDADQRGALTSLADGPFGSVLVTIVALGLLGYAVWQLWSATKDKDGLLDQLKRIGTVGLGISYAGIAIDGLRIAWADGSKGGDGESATSPEGIADFVLDLPGGAILVALIGIGVGAIGIYHLQKGGRGEFLDDIDTDGLGERRLTGLRVLGTAGFVGRAAVLAIAGWMAVDAAIQHSPDRAAGMDQSLRELIEAPGGRWLLGITGAALICAGGYDAITFRRQRID